MNEEKMAGRSAMPGDRKDGELGEEALEAVAGGVSPFWGNCDICQTYFNLTASSRKVIDGVEKWVCPKCADELGLA
ncbi:MAG: hypothetical protein J5449_11040 [Oscillospiraceae bacterium]|nr:hypothetical protein [Oscillospiraceae bacterium]